MWHRNNKIITLAPSSDFKHCIIPNTKYERKNLQSNEATILLRAGDSINSITQRIIVYNCLCLSGSCLEKFIKGDKSRSNITNTRPNSQLFESLNIDTYRNDSRGFKSNTNGDTFDTHSNIQESHGHNVCSFQNKIMDRRRTANRRSPLHQIVELVPLLHARSRRPEMADAIQKSRTDQLTVIFCIMTHGDDSSLILYDKFGSPTYVNRSKLCVELLGLGSVFGATNVLILDSSCRNAGSISLDQILIPKCVDDERLVKLTVDPVKFVSRLVANHIDKLFTNCTHRHEGNFLFSLSNHEGNGYWSAVWDKKLGILIVTPVHVFLYALFECNNYARYNPKVRNQLCFVCLFNVLSKEAFGIMSISPTITMLDYIQANIFLESHAVYIKESLLRDVISLREYHNVREVASTILTNNDPDEVEDMYWVMRSNGAINPKYGISPSQSILHKPKSKQQLRQSPRYVPLTHSLMKCTKGCCYVPLVGYVK